MSGRLKGQGDLLIGKMKKEKIKDRRYITK